MWIFHREYQNVNFEKVLHTQHWALARNFVEKNLKKKINSRFFWKIVYVESERCDTYQCHFIHLTQKKIIGLPEFETHPKKSSVAHLIRIPNIMPWKPEESCLKKKFSCFGTQAIDKK